MKNISERLLLYLSNCCFHQCFHLLLHRLIDSQRDHHHILNFIFNVVAVFDNIFEVVLEVANWIHILKVVIKNYMRARSALEVILILWIKSKVGLIGHSFNLITSTDRRSGSIGVNKQHSYIDWQHIFFIFYNEIQNRFNICHVDNRIFLPKRNIQATYIINISNQAIYREDRVGNLKLSFDFTCRNHNYFPALCALT